MSDLVGIHKTNWIWTKGHAAHEDNNRCDWLAQNAARTQTSSWPDGTPHGRLRLDLGRDYVPPKPQAGLFDTPDPGENDEDESDTGGPKLRVGSPMRPGCRSRLQHDRWNDYRDFGGRDDAVDSQQRRRF